MKIKIVAQHNPHDVEQKLFEAARSIADRGDLDAAIADIGFAVRMTLTAVDASTLDVVTTLVLRAMLAQRANGSREQAEGHDDIDARFHALSDAETREFVSVFFGGHKNQ